MRFKRLTLIIPDHLEVEVGQNLTLNQPGSWLADGQVLQVSEAYEGCHACGRNLNDLNPNTPYCGVCLPTREVRFKGVRCQDCHIPLIKKASLMWRMCLQCRRKAGVTA